MDPQLADRVSIPRLDEPPALALGPVEAFVLSKVDGRRSIFDLAVMVGLTEPEVESILQRLSALGAVVVDTCALDDEVEDGTESSRPTWPSDPLSPFHCSTSPGEAPADVLRAAGASSERRRPGAD